jgi:hypothetical protein
MTESLWLEQLQDHTSRLCLVTAGSAQTILEQASRFHTLADPWRGQWICVISGADERAITTVSADGSMQLFSGLPNDLEWRPKAFSADGKQLLIVGLDATEHIRALGICCIEGRDGAQFQLEHLLRLKSHMTCFSPQFCEDQIGVFVSRNGEKLLRYHEWSYTDSDQDHLVMLGFPPVQLVTDFGWSRSADGQFIHVVGDFPTLKRQQLMRLVSGSDAPTPLGEMMPAFDAVRFSTSSSCAYFADSTVVGRFDLNSGLMAESVGLNQRIILELTLSTESVVDLQFLEGETVCLGQWHVDSDEIVVFHSANAPITGWGTIAVDLPHSNTQTYSIESLTETQTPDPASFKLTQRDEDHATDSDDDSLGTVNEAALELGTVSQDGTVDSSSESTLDDVPLQSKSVMADVPKPDHGEDAHKASLTSAQSAAAVDTKATDEGLTGTSAVSRHDQTVQSEHDSSSVEQNPSSAVVFDPRTEFAQWLAQTAEHEDPEVRLRSLKAYRSDPQVIEQSVEHLQSSLEALSTNEDLVLEVIVAIAAAAELRAQSARPLLEQMCAAARGRLLEHATLPFVEEHFSLAALRALDQPEGRFSLVVVYEEYEQIIQTVSREDVSDEKRRKILKRTTTRYRRALEHVLFDQVDQSESGTDIDQHEVEKTKSAEPLSSPANRLDTSETPAESVSAQAYRFKPLAQRFPAQAQPWQPTGASLSNRASSDILRLEDFGPTGDMSFQAHAEIRRAPKWVKGIVFAMSCLGGFLSLAVLMLGFEYASVLILSGLSLGLGSLAILGSAFKHWAMGIMLFFVGIISLMIVPNTITLPEAVGPWVFWGPALVFIGFVGILLNGHVRASFTQSHLLDDELD